MTAPAKPVPDARRFTARSMVPTRITFTTDPATWAPRSREQIENFPPESRWTIEFPPDSGIYCTIVRNGRDGSFTLLARHGLQARHLAGLRMAERVPIDPERVMR